MIYFPKKSQAENDAFSGFLDQIHNHLVYVLREKFGWHDLDVLPKISYGGGHVVIQFEKHGQRLIFRVPQHDVAQLNRSILAYRHLGNYGLMPEKIYNDGKCIIEVYVDGQSLNPTVSSQLIINMAQKLSSMHALPTSNYGPLAFDFHGIYTDAQAYYRARSPIKVNRSEEDLTEVESDLINSALKKVNEIHADLLTARTYIGHGDLWRKNILVKQDEFKIIDWDKIGAYPIEHDLIFMIDADFTEGQKNLFFSNYSQKVNLDLFKWFALCITMSNPRLRLRNKINKIRQHGLL